ncbi:MAG: rod shape-determining protein RodA [Rikenellaceae bacterium]
MSSYSNRGGGGFFAGVDAVAIALYVALVAVGCICITSASFDDTTSDIFAFSHFYIKQIIWVGVAFLAAITVLLVDVSFFHRYAYILYGVGLILLLATLAFGREVNGAKAWFEFGSFRVQPVEMVKIATGLAVARVMSDYSFSIDNFKDLVKVCVVLAVPLGIIILQNDTGSGIVFGSFLFVFYREGLNSWLCVPVFLVATLFIISFIFSPLFLLVISLLVCTVCDAMMTREYRNHTIFVAYLMLGTMAIYLLSWLIFDDPFSLFTSLLINSIVAIVVVGAYALRRQLSNTLFIVASFIFTMLFLPTTNYIFTSILRDHQRNRIMTFLGMIDDPLGTGYNVNQAKIAIGSGGLFGKGFLQGTQIKYGFVPEKHTDFIFCALCEEWGFIGAIVLLGCFGLLIFRLIRMGERQQETFGRVYCYCVASILLFHTLVNVGMTIGLMPVMGIPLPFMSYGGSSLVAFTVLLFVAIRLDSAANRDVR